MGQFVFKYPEAGTTTTFTYTATGAEGSTLVVPVLAGKNLILVTLNSVTLIPETPPPDSQGYSYDAATTTFTFGFPILLGYVFQIVYS
jgi:hypothetical protein